MTEAMRHEIVQRHQGGMSMRAIAQELRVSALNFQAEYR
jgi:hypothetical protein